MKRRYIGIEKEFGEIQFEVLPKIKEAVKIFKRKNVTKVLDLGCGTGKHSIYLANKGFEVYAGDINEENIDKVKHKVQQVKLSNVKSCRIDMRKLPFEDNSFGGIICISTLHHGTFNDVKTTIDEVYRVLKPNGILIANILSTEDYSFGVGKQIERNTFVGGRKGEEGIPHHYSDEQELRELLKKFIKYKISKVEYIYRIKKDKQYFSKAFEIKANK